MVVEYKDEYFHFSASSIEASFGVERDDVKTKKLDTVTIQRDTPVGDQIILTSSSSKSSNNNINQADEDHVEEGRDETVPAVEEIRLIFISPELDWRKNQNYIWKLNGAWMSDPTYMWLHWNVESNINSIIQIPSPSLSSSLTTATSNITTNKLFGCDYMEFDFTAIGSRRRESNAKVIFHDVQMGTHISAPSSDKDHLLIERPCIGEKTKKTCSVVNGKVETLLDKMTGGIPLWKIILVGGILMWILLQCYRTICEWRKFNRYHEINSTSDDDDDDDDDDDLGLEIVESGTDTNHETAEVH